jgi:arylsulfatase
VEKQIEQLQAGIASTTGSDSGATLKKLQQQMELLQSQEQRQQEAKSSASQQQQQLPAKKAPPMPFASTNPRKLEKDSNNNHTNTKKKKMNIVLLYADDWTYKTLGKINPYVQTPNLDKLADKGVMFTHNCVTTSICWMSRATLITGQYVSTHKNMWPQDGKFYEDWNNTLFGQMAANGYHNALFGKWHNGMNDKYLKQSLHSRRFYYGYHINDKGKHITQENEDHAMEFLKSKPYKKKPFFLTVSFFATHAVDGDPKQYYAMNSSMSLYTNENVTFPSNGGDEAWKRMPYFIGDRCEGRARWKKRYLTLAMFQHHMKNMYRMATEVDTACGNIIAELERQGIRDNTMIIFTTDNGNFHSEHGMSEKWFPHEESIRVPLIVWDPRMDRGKAGMVNDDFTLNVDLAPTILSVSYAIHTQNRLLVYHRQCLCMVNLYALIPILLVRCNIHMHHRPLAFIHHQPCKDETLRHSIFRTTSLSMNHGETNSSMNGPVPLAHHMVRRGSCRKLRRL